MLDGALVPPDVVGANPVEEKKVAGGQVRGRYGFLVFQPSRITRGKILLLVDLAKLMANEIVNLKL